MVVVKNPDRHVTVIDHYGVAETNDQYGVLKVTLKNGAGQFIVDFSGAQFGFYDALVPFQTFCERHVHNDSFTRKWGRAGWDKYEQLCVYNGPVPPAMTTRVPAIIPNRSGYIFESELMSLMNMVMRAHGSLATMTPEKVHQITTSDIEWQKRFLTSVEVGIRRAAQEADGRAETLAAESMMKFMRNPRECPPFRGYGDFLSYDGSGSRPTS